MNDATFEVRKASDLVVEENIRTAISPDALADLRASIERHGIMQPVVAWQAAGEIRVLMGQRRTLAAQMLGPDTDVPTLVHPVKPDTVERILTQWDENERRAALGESDRIRAVEQLALEGLTEAKIAKVTGLAKESVVQARKVATSAVLASADQLSLEEAAALAELDEAPEKQAELVETFTSGHGGPWMIRRALNDHHDQVASTALADQIAGERTLVEPPGWDSATRPIIDLVDEEGNPVDHGDCPGAVWWIETIPADQLDEADCHVVSGSRGARLVEGCTNPAARGHRARYGTLKAPAAAEMTDEQREQAKAARREVIENNKAWDAAADLRREWLAQFALRKTPPVGHEKAIAALTLAPSWELDPVHEALALLDWRSEEVAAEVETGSGKRASQISATIALARWESRASRDTWRNPTRTDARVLRTMADWGHNLSDIEQRITKQGC